MPPCLDNIDVAVLFALFFIRYEKANALPPECIWVDRGCCSQSGSPSIMKILHPWQCSIRLDIFHFIRRIGLAADSEHHPAFGTFMSHLSYAIFEYHEEDLTRLREAKKAELMNTGRNPTAHQVSLLIAMKFSYKIESIVLRVNAQYCTPL